MINIKCTSTKCIRRRVQELLLSFFEESTTGDSCDSCPWTSSPLRHDVHSLKVNIAAAAGNDCNISSSTQPVRLREFRDVPSSASDGSTGGIRLYDDASSSSSNDDTATSSPFLPLMQTWSYGACTQPLSWVVHVVPKYNQSYSDRLHVQLLTNLS